MALTETMVDNFVDLAGDGFMWEGVRGSHRPPSSVRRALRDDLANRQGGICPVGGEMLPGFSATEGNNWTAGVEFNHVVARGPMVKGFVVGNVFAGCAAHNAMTKPIYDENGNLISGIEILRVSHFARPDVIPTEWTPFPTLRAANKR